MREWLSDRRYCTEIDLGVVIDAATLVLISSLLAVIQVGLPSPIRSGLAFSHQEFALWTLWTSAYVHHGLPHLLQNLMGFIGVAVVANILCRRIDARRWFWMTTGVFLVVLPILVNLSSYTLLEMIVPEATPVERGFSGVVAGLVGFLFIAFVVWVAKRSGRGIAQAVGQATILLMFWEISLIYAGAIDMVVTALVVLGLGLSGWLAVSSVPLPRVWNRRQTMVDVQLGLGIVAVLLFFVVALFPADIVSGGTATNIFAHAAGFVWGAVVASGSWIACSRSHIPVLGDIRIGEFDVTEEMMDSIHQTYRMLLGGAAGGLISSYIIGGVSDIVLAPLAGALLLIAFFGDMSIKYVLEIVPQDRDSTQAD